MSYQGRIMLRFVLLLSVAASGCERETATPVLPELPEGIEAISLLGDSLAAPPVSDAARTVYNERLAEARAVFDANPDDAEAIIWLGRRTAYLGHYRDAIEIYTTGIAKYPDLPHLYRHRGHRYLSVRALDLAISDFERGVELTAGQPDEVEPDGLPNARNTPTSTLQSNLWYHLGLAHYLRGDYENALRAYEACQGVSRNNDMKVATTYWHFMTLHRLDRHDEASALLVDITPDMDIIENQSYHRLLRLFKGELQPEDVLDTSADDNAPLANATVGYGVGFWYRMQGRDGEAMETWRSTVAGPQWSGFGYLAAEAEVARATSGM